MSPVQNFSMFHCDLKKLGLPFCLVLFSNETGLVSFFWDTQSRFSSQLNDLRPHVSAFVKRLSIFYGIRKMSIHAESVCHIVLELRRTPTPQWSVSILRLGYRTRHNSPGTVTFNEKDLVLWRDHAHGKQACEECKLWNVIHLQSQNLGGIWINSWEMGLSQRTF